MSTTNILDLNNRIDELTESYPANKVMMSDGVTSVEDALDGLIDRGSISVVGDGVKTITQCFNELFAKVDFSKISANTKLIYAGQVATLSAWTSTRLIFFTISMGTTNCYINQYLFQSTDSSLLSKLNNNNATDTSSAVLNSGAKVIIYY